MNGSKIKPKILGFNSLKEPRDSPNLIDLLLIITPSPATKTATTTPNNRFFFIKISSGFITPGRKISKTDLNYLASLPQIHEE